VEEDEENGEERLLNFYVLWKAMFEKKEEKRETL
jgi:hypothetical protein